MLKVEACGTKAQAVRDFLALGSQIYTKVMAKFEEFAKGFNLAIDRLLRLGLIAADFNSQGRVEMDQDTNGNPRPVVEPEDDLDMDVVMVDRGVSAPRGTRARA